LNEGDDFSRLDTNIGIVGRNMELFYDPEKVRAVGSKAYRFMPACEARIAGLNSKQIYMSDPKSFNDLFDVNLPIEDLTYQGPFGKRIKKAVEICIEKNDELANHWFYDRELIGALEGWVRDEEGKLGIGIISRIKARMRGFGVACFTPYMESALMWAHYAEKHAGFAVEYTVRPLEIAIYAPEYMQLKVQYVSALEKTCLSEVLFAPHQVLSRFLATKTVDWSYEKEWRLVHFEKCGGFADIPRGMEVSGLVAGPRTSPENFQLLSGRASELNVPIWCFGENRDRA
jgi:hypothetical protein